MTNRERLVRTLCCQPTDRAPWVSWMGFSPWGETRGRWIRESGFRGRPEEFGPWRERLFGLEPELVRDIMETNTTLWLALYERIAESAPIEHIHIWEDMAGKQGSLISPAMVEEFMMPQYDRLSEFARRRGVPVFSVDSDGRVDELVPVMMRHGVNAFMPFEVQAGSDIEAFRAKYPKLGIFGGLDKRALAAGRPEMHRELDRAGRMLAAGGWVPGFDHLIPPDVPWDNYRYFMAGLRQLVAP